MEFTGKAVSAGKDWATGKYTVTFSVNEESAMRELGGLMECDKVRVKAGKWRNKRSLDANAYLWVLLQKIAEALDSDRWSVYLEMLKRYSGAFTFLIVKEGALERFESLDAFRACIDLGEVEVGGSKWHQLQLFYGSSTFDTEEMSVLLDGVVSECRELGIETMPPDELQRLVGAWHGR